MCEVNLVFCFPINKMRAIIFKFLQALISRPMKVSSDKLVTSLNAASGSVLSSLVLKVLLRDYQAFSTMPSSCLHSVWKNWVIFHCLLCKKMGVLDLNMKFTSTLYRLIRLKGIYRSYYDPHEYLLQSKFSISDSIYKFSKHIDTYTKFTWSKTQENFPTLKQENLVF